MLKNQNIICISSIDWDFNWQGHQEIMSTLAKNGNRVLFIENTGVRVPGLRDIARIKKRIKNWFKGVRGIRKEMENLYIFSPLVLPFPYARIARWINYHLVFSILEKWTKAMDFSDPLVWTFLPTPLSVDIIDTLTKKIVIYYCIDNFMVSSLSAKKIRRSEIKLLKRADLVFVTSKGLYNYCSQYNDRVFSFPFAVNFKEFENARIDDDAEVEEFRDIKRPIIGYVGGIHKWIDIRLVRDLAQRRREYSFVFIGPVVTDVSLLSGLGNIYFLGNKEHNRIPSFVKNFDVCIIPYLLTDYTKNVYPTKLNEYLAMGKAVVSTNLPEVMAFNEEYGDVVFAADDEDKFSEYIDTSVSDEEVPALKKRRIEVARENSWESRIEKMSDLIEKEVERKKIDIDTRWRENLLKFYRLTRRKAMRLTANCILAYLLLFKTPFIWLVAEPLKISEAPQAADVIVAFGGGVGETGSPGKSTIERARYAAQLYKQGYAKRIIFSSGYTYDYNDAENMKLFAISMGIADEDIILEQKANSTYENVLFSKQILDKNQWGSIILVSSPYNMRRASLVFKRWAPDEKILYSPVDRSQFYDRSYGVKTEQIRAIMHEYLGILYYWFKGYI